RERGLRRRRPPKRQDRSSYNMIARMGKARGVDMSYGRTIASAVFCATLSLALLSEPLAGQCVDYSKDPAGCQPSTFDTPIGQMPSVRVGREGNLDPSSSEADARAGVAKLERELHLFRNIEPLHWVLTVPSVKDPATGAW